MTQNKKELQLFSTDLGIGATIYYDIHSASVYCFRTVVDDTIAWVVEGYIVRDDADQTAHDYRLGTYGTERGALNLCQKVADANNVTNEAHLIDMECGDDDLEALLHPQEDEVATGLEELHNSLTELDMSMNELDAAITKLDLRIGAMEQDTIQVEMDRFARDAEEAFNNGADLIETCVALHRNIYTAFSIIYLSDTIARYDYGEVTEEQCNHILLKLGKYDFNRLETITLEDLPALIRLKAMGQKYIYIVRDAQDEENRFLLSPQGMQDMAINLYDDIEESEGFNEADCIEVLNISEYPVTYIEMAYGQPCTPLELQRLYDKREAGSYYTYDAEDKEYIGMVIFASGYLEERFKRFEDLQLWLKENAK